MRNIPSARSGFHLARYKNPTRKLAHALLILTGMSPMLAASADYVKCTAIVPDAERLACYDQIAAQAVTPALTVPAPRQASAELRVDDGVSDSFLGKGWELDERAKRGTFRYHEHKPVYVLPVHYSNSPNSSPTSPAPDHSSLTPTPVGHNEMKYQLSFKTKLSEDLLGDNGSLWFAYTQQSYWLVYNQQVSSPFRETNYEPEVIFSLRTDVDLPGIRWRMLNLGLVHQSNGHGLPLSRSWNRVYAQFGLERDNFALLLRPWLRLRENGENDDNPDIARYMGNGDVVLNYNSGNNSYSALARYSASGKHGALQLSWGFPISHALKGYVQVFSGYGESLIDYNHNQTTIGVGLSLHDWR